MRLAEGLVEMVATEEVRAVAAGLQASKKSLLPGEAHFRFCTGILLLMLALC